MAELQFTEFMGENVIRSLKFCGKNVVLYATCKIQRPQFAELDDFSRVMDFSFIDAGESFKLGKYSIITWHVVIEGTAKTFIGDRCFIGPGSKLLTSTYELNGWYSSELLPAGAHKTRYGDIVIKDDAYIGANCTIMPGVMIGEGAVVGANALVNKDLEPWGIYVGTPCKKIGEREEPSNNCKDIISKLNWDNHLF